MRLVFALVVALSLAGCPGPTFVVQQYRGPARPEASIATLRVNGSEAVRLLTLDDEDVAAPLEVDSRLHIELLPGRHTVGVGNASTPHDRWPAIAFEAEAGKVYRVTFVGGAPRIFEVTRAGDTPGRDATIDPSIAEPATPKKATSEPPATDHP
ncbi:MAG: hypothetical protein KF819_38870 [Labilithrix sp.]|nr:hypothetical protein [Labilithrix sp.]